MSMRRWLRIRWLRWKIRNYKISDHYDCLGALGPCISPSPSCMEVIELHRLQREASLPRAELR